MRAGLKNIWRRLFLSLGVLLIIILFVSTLLWMIDFQEVLDHPFYRLRKVGNFSELWKNGFFGPFFNTALFGYFGLIAIPAFLLFLSRWKYFSARLRVEAIVLLVFVLVLFGYGFSNFRYSGSFFIFLPLLTFSAYQLSGLSKTVIKKLYLGLSVVIFASSWSLLQKNSKFLRSSLNPKPSPRIKVSQEIKQLELKPEAVLVANTIEPFYILDGNFPFWLALRKKLPAEASALKAALLGMGIQYVLFEDVFAQFHAFSLLAELLEQEAEVVFQRSGVKLYRLKQTR